MFPMRKINDDPEWMAKWDRLTICRKNDDKCQFLIWTEKSNLIFTIRTASEYDILLKEYAKIEVGSDSCSYFLLWSGRFLFEDLNFFPCKVRVLNLLSKKLLILIW